MSTDSRIAVVTGAAQGIGREIALRLADDGIDVAVNDIANNANNLADVVKAIQAKGRRSVLLLADVSNEDEVRSMVEMTVEKLGGLDIMVANAGIAQAVALVDINSTEAWDRTMSVNVRGPMLCYKYAALQMIKQGRGGRIIGASSILGKQGGKQLSAYSASKFAVRGLTQSLALELAKDNITVNAYCPGVILTAMSDMPEDQLHGGKHGSMIKLLAGIPVDWPDAGPDVIASVVSYLAKPEAYFITGQSIDVNGVVGIS